VEDFKREDDIRDEELANLYEYLVLRDSHVPAELVGAMTDAYRRVHLRGLDPLRRAAR
jgi:hypothetical protein